jgi:hypothetical protein
MILCHDRWSGTLSRQDRLGDHPRLETKGCPGKIAVGIGECRKNEGVILRICMTVRSDGPTGMCIFGKRQYEILPKECLEETLSAQKKGREVEEGLSRGNPWLLNVAERGCRRKAEGAAPSGVKFSANVFSTPSLNHHRYRQLTFRGMALDGPRAWLMSCTFEFELKHCLPLSKPNELLQVVRRGQ